MAGYRTTRMIDLCYKHGLPVPEYSLHSGGFNICFRFKINMQEISERKPEKNHMVELSKQQQLIIEILKHYPHLKAFEIMQKLGDQQPARRTLLDDLFILKKLGIVDSHGHTRSIV